MQRILTLIKIYLQFFPIRQLAHTQSRRITRGAGHLVKRVCVLCLIRYIHL